VANILCVDDDPALLTLLRKALERLGHAAVEAPGVPAALTALANQPVDLVVSDYNMPGATGIDLLEVMRQQGHDAPLIMLTGHGSIEHAVAAIKAGAIDYLTKPFRPQQLELAVTAGLEVARLRRENTALKREVTALRGSRKILGESVGIRRVLETAATAAPTRATILLQGESGTGKELIARAIHDWSDRRDRPFIQLNCAALPEGLIESALFGHEKGAFTGAIRRVEGAFERAHGGTLLLDEISEMRLDLQAKLLRVLQEQEFERVGGTAPISVDVRVIATTNRDLSAEAAAGTFRQDLYYRIAVIPLSVPPLRERRDDIPRMAMHFAQRAAEQTNRSVRGFTPDAIAWLQSREWPGNVRELQHAVERAVILTRDEEISSEAFDPRRFSLAAAAAKVSRAGDGDDGVVLSSLRLDDAERVLIDRALKATKGNRTQAAKLLGIGVRTLRTKLNATSGPMSDEADAPSA
jgi:two-component system response regulator HydG